MPANLTPAEMVKPLITPEQVKRAEPRQGIVGRLLSNLGISLATPKARMPTFEEFVHLYINHNQKIHTVINQFNVALWDSFKICQDLLNEAHSAGVPEYSLPDWAWMAARKRVMVLEKLWLQT